MVTKLVYHGKPFFTRGKVQTDCWRCKELYFSTLGQLATVLVLYFSQIIFENLPGLQKNASFPLLVFFSCHLQRAPITYEKGTNTGKSAYLQKSICNPEVNTRTLSW